MEKIALIGATGFVGSAIREEAESRNIKIHGIGRHTEPANGNYGSEVTAVDLSDTEALAVALGGFETVVCSFIPDRNKPGLYDRIIEGYNSIIEATRGAGGRRLLVVGGAGSLMVGEGVMLMDTDGFPEHLIPEARGMADVYMKLLNGVKEPDWVVLCPSAEMYDGVRTGWYETGKDSVILDLKGNSRISVQDFAKAMIDEVENPRHHHERFTVGYREPVEA